MEPLTIQPPPMTMPETGVGGPPLPPGDLGMQEPLLPEEPKPQPELGLEPAPEPLDPLSAAIDFIMSIPGPEAVRRVYHLALSAARAKATIKTRLHQMDARAYHAALSVSPEAKYADDLMLAKRELDTLAQERRRLNLEAVRARESGRPASIYEMQAEAANVAMESVALGMLLFLALPNGLPTQQPQPQELQQQEIPI
jgi:hypothetical protein